MTTATAKTATKAIDCQVGRSLLAQIKTNAEWAGKTLEDAEAISMAINGWPLEAITVEQAYAVLRALATDQPQELHDGYCMTCERPSSLRQCMDCREGRSEGYGSVQRSV